MSSESAVFACINFDPLKCAISAQRTEQFFFNSEKKVKKHTQTNWWRRKTFVLRTQLYILYVLCVCIQRLHDIIMNVKKVLSRSTTTNHKF